MKLNLFAALIVLPLAGGCQADTMGPGVAGDEAPLLATHGVTASVTGSAHLTVFPPDLVPQPGLALRRLTISARRQGDGPVSGEWQVVAGATILHGDIDCMTIAPDGSSARLSGIVTNAQFSLFELGTAFAIEVVDGESEPDVSTQLRAFRNAEPAVGRAFCETGVVPEGADLDPLPTEHGNFTIRSDA